MPDVSPEIIGRQAFPRRARWLILGACSDQGKLADSNKGPVESSEKLLIFKVLQPTDASKDLVPHVSWNTEGLHTNTPTYMRFTHRMELF